MICDKALECHSEVVSSYFTNIQNNIIYINSGSLQYFYWKRDTYEGPYVACLHFNYERIKRRQYLTNILKCDTSSGDMKENINHWLDLFEKFHKKYVIIPKELYTTPFTEESRYIAV